MVEKLFLLLCCLKKSPPKGIEPLTLSTQYWLPYLCTTVSLTIKLECGSQYIKKEIMNPNVDDILQFCRIL